MLLNPGGVVIKGGDEVIGAIGVSGAPGGDNDAVCAKAALENIKDRMRVSPHLPPAFSTGMLFRA